MVMADPGSLDSAPNFGFAFNDVNFSDRVLRIKISPDVPDDAHADDPAPNRKRRRADQFGNANDSTIRPCVEQILKCNFTDLEDVSTYGNQDTAVLMINASPEGAETALNQSGHDAEASKEESISMARFTIATVNVKTIHISSPILAAKSQFFYKLFSNGMKESEQREVTLQIQASEEDAFMDLLNFMYRNTLQRTTPTTLLNVLMAADKYEVPSCMRYCSKLLRDKPMTCESALDYLNLPLHVLMTDSVLPLAGAAKQFFATSFKDIIKFQEEVLNLPIAGFEAVLFSDYLQAPSEDAIYDLVVKWARRHYPRLEERRQILSTRLLRVIRFPCMTTRKLRKVLICGDIESDLASKVVLDALFFKSEASYRQRALLDDANASFHRYIERAYRYRPVKVVEFELPRPQCIVYLDLKREECTQLFPAGRVYSVAFNLGGQGFFLSGHCNLDQQSLVHCFGLFLGMQDKGSDHAIAIDYDLAARVKPSWEFISQYKGSYSFVGGKAVGYRNLFGVPWNAFIADESPLFINGVLYLKAELTIREG